MAKLIILYGHPTDPDAFEDYHANRHVPYASQHMPNVRGAENLRITGAPDGAAPPYYRITQLSYDSVEDLHAGLASDEGRAVLADLAHFATGGASLMVSDD